MTRQFFENAADALQDPFPALAKLSFATRPCLVSDEFEAFDTQTSDEFIRDLCDTFSYMELWSLDYKCINFDGSLNWVEVFDLDLHGVLWATGQTKHLDFRVKGSDDPVKRQSKSMKGTDPFAPKVVQEAVKAFDKSLDRPK